MSTIGRNCSKLSPTRPPTSRNFGRACARPRLALGYSSPDYSGRWPAASAFCWSRRKRDLPRHPSWAENNHEHAADDFREQQAGLESVGGLGVYRAALSARGSPRFGRLEPAPARVRLKGADRHSLPFLRQHALRSSLFQFRLRRRVALESADVPRLYRCRAVVRSLV